MPRGPLLAALLLLPATSGVAAPADAAGDLPPPGSLAPSIACRERPDQRYALYLPPAAAKGEPLPLLLIMDPRGRATVAMEVFQAAAGERGWLAASSWNTASDGPADVNVAAVNAILPDLASRIPFDRKRLYLAGFSGTARAAWTFAGALPGKIAGVIAVGAGLPEGAKAEPDPSFVYFNATGRTDFNYEEVRALQERLAALRFPARFRFFEGGHQWPGPAEGREAIEWLELMAMKRGLRPRDDRLVALVEERRIASARAAEAGGAAAEAWERWRAIEEDFDGPAPGEEAGRRAAALGSSPAVRAFLAGRKRQRAAQIAFERKLFDLLARYKGAPPPPSLRAATRDLQIAALKRRAESSEPEEAAAASRLLNLLFVHASFYGPRELEDAGRPARALDLLDLAAAVREGPFLCYERARLLARLSRQAEALEALRCWARAPQASDADLEGEAAFAPLRELPGYRTLRDALAARKPAS